MPLSTVADHLEHHIRGHTNTLRILELQRSFTNLDTPLVVPGRVLIKSGQLRRMDRAGVEETRTFLLFNDIMIHASGGDGGWGLKLLLDGITGLGDVSRSNRQFVPNRGGSSSLDVLGGTYVLRHRFRLEHLTIVGVEDKKHSFEIRTSESSFTVFAGRYTSK